MKKKLNKENVCNTFVIRNGVESLIFISFVFCNSESNVSLTNTFASTSTKRTKVSCDGKAGIQALLLYSQGKIQFKLSIPV